MSTESSGPQTRASNEVLRWNEEKETLTEDNLRLRNQLQDSQMSLVVVADENEALTGQKEALARQQAELEAEMMTEKKQMMERQRELELLLQNALKAEEDKENAKERSPKKRFKRLVLSTRRPPSPRVPSSPRMPLSLRVC